MQTNLHDRFKGTQAGNQAEAILRSCVHCGFCNATCPTYLLQGDERDGPRGRIYLIKQLLETGHASEKTRLHLDRCLSCRNCETTCPSGVEYGQLLDIGRDIIEAEQKRPAHEQLLRKLLMFIMPFPTRLKALLGLARVARPFMPRAMKVMIPAKQETGRWPEPRSEDRVMLALAGCVQSAATPKTNAAAARVLSHLGIRLEEVAEAGCCGAMSYHMSEHEKALASMRANIDAWWPAIEAGAEAIVMTASGCGAVVKDYGRLLQQDEKYRHKAERVSELAKDLSEILLSEDLSSLPKAANSEKIAVHCPCSLQHAQKLPVALKTVLVKAGFTLSETTDDHLCCGSAGTYSLMQPALSEQLLDKKLSALTGANPARIVTANIGCQLHLQKKAKVPVTHWIELLDELIG